MRVAVVIGTRPEAIKMAPVVSALRRTGWLTPVVLLTGQHRDLLDSALASFDIEPDENLGLMTDGQTLAQLTGRAFMALEPALKRHDPALVLGQGDTTTVMAAAVTSFYLGLPFGHVEAGLRTGDIAQPFPEEFNRVVAGRTARFHFAPTRSAVEALRREHVPADRVFLTGNTVIDALADAAARVDEGRFRPARGRRLILMTAHRREQFGGGLAAVMGAVRRVVEARPDVELLFPAHPNPSVREAAEVLAGHDRIRVVEPLGYLDFVAAMKAADVIVTDSGGVQEEAPFLGKPVLVTREVTERPDAVTSGAARLVGADPAVLEHELLRLLDEPASYAAMVRCGSPYGDGRAADRIVSVLEAALGRPRRDPPPMFEPAVLIRELAEA